LYPLPVVLLTFLISATVNRRVSFRYKIYSGVSERIAFHLQPHILVGSIKYTTISDDFSNVSLMPNKNE
jgi:hypothetical protein